MKQWFIVASTWVQQEDGKQITTRWVSEVLTTSEEAAIGTVVIAGRKAFPGGEMSQSRAYQLDIEGMFNRWKAANS